MLRVREPDCLEKKQKEFLLWTSMHHDNDFLHSFWVLDFLRGILPSKESIQTSWTIHRFWWVGKDDVSCITLDVISCSMFPKSGGNIQTKIPVGEILEALGDPCFVGGRVSRDGGYPEDYDMPAICKWCGHCGPWTCWRYFCEVDEVCWWSCRRPRSRRLCPSWSLRFVKVPTGSALKKKGAKLVEKNPGFELVSTS